MFEVTTFNPRRAGKYAEMHLQKAKGNEKKLWKRVTLREVHKLLQNQMYIYIKFKFTFFIKFSISFSIVI